MEERHISQALHEFVNTYGIKNMILIGENGEIRNIEVHNEE